MNDTKWESIAKIVMWAVSVVLIGLAIIITKDIKPLGFLVIPAVIHLTT